ncbi:MAG: hypothetical protein ACI814_003723 [Mariniblastus sp.]
MWVAFFVLVSRDAKPAGRGAFRATLELLAERLIFSFR